MYNLVFLISRSAFWLLDRTPTQSLIWTVLDYSLSDFVYACDILVKFLTGYMENGIMCFDHLKIAKRYVQTLEFKIDLISLIPTDLFYFYYFVWSSSSSSLLSSSSSSSSLFSSFLPSSFSRFNFSHDRPRELLAALRLNRLLKFSRFVEFRSITETETKYPTVFRLTNLLINILLAMHWNACVYFAMSRWIGFGNDEWVFPKLVDVNDTEAIISDVHPNNILLTAQLVVFFLISIYFYNFVKIKFSF